MKPRWLPTFICILITLSVSAETFDLFLLAGQSNAQGWKGDGAQYPNDPDNLDKTIPLYWVSPGISSSNGTWTTLQKQGGRFKQGHFGLEVTFARSLKKAGYHPAIFKYTLGSTSMARNWKAPGANGMYDRMTTDLLKARNLLEKDGNEVRMGGFVWIQGESDAQTAAMADAYKERLALLINDLRNTVTQTPNLPIVLGVDEQHIWVQQHPQVIQAQQELAKDDPNMVFTSMIGLEKADTTHLTPKGLEEHGLRVFNAYSRLIGN
jgi:hypothetical protein